MEIIKYEQLILLIDFNKKSHTLLETQRNAFIKYSQKQVISKLPLHAEFPDNHVDCHVKAGYQINAKYFVIKTMTGFYDKTGGQQDGSVSIFLQKNGSLHKFIHDKGLLTKIRTSIAPILAIKSLAKTSE